MSCQPTHTPHNILAYDDPDYDVNIKAAQEKLEGGYYACIKEATRKENVRPKLLAISFHSS
jgi:hypothetical protein